MSARQPSRRSGLRAALVMAGLLIVAAVTLVLVRGSSEPAATGPALPPSPRSALDPKNVPLGPRPTAYWAPVVAAGSAYARPAGAQVAWVPAQTPEDTTNIVLVLGQAERQRGELWVRVRVAGSPDDVVGWMPRRALGGYTPVRTRLVVDLEGRTATLLRDGRRIFRTAVGIGTAATPTPMGRFYVRNLLHKYSSPFYGPVAFGTSARSPQASDWPAGGFVGIHGTDQPELIPGEVSHGCIRMKNRDILRLARLMPVGTPVRVS